MRIVFKLSFNILGKKGGDMQQNSIIMFDILLNPIIIVNSGKLNK